MLLPTSRSPSPSRSDCPPLVEPVPLNGGVRMVLSVPLAAPPEMFVLRKEPISTCRPSFVTLASGPVTVTQASRLIVWPVALTVADFPPPGRRRSTTADRCWRDSSGSMIEALCDDDGRRLRRVESEDFIAPP